MQLSSLGIKGERMTNP